ncbi:TonB-dependent receptor domain-containing protein [uncultured Cohaesibacter sp.]|uniref:TonB-dependent receptor domain-containing protein n=1 Tax=uncultured Cohaesibacter sp. TaxID=1002546 RepID=UPI0029C66F0A|nr:TonB-dependent receptor [uncultured Cohaesibacter sp.]
MNRMLLVTLAASTMFQPVTRSLAEDLSDDLTSMNILDRIVVSTGTAKVAIDTPQAVTVLNQEDIDEAQPDTLGDLFKFVPGVTATGADSALGQSFNIRGIGSAESTGESKIIMQVDGVNKFYEQYRMGSYFLDPELLKSVEVLRGPASSTLYGAGALGGVVSMTTKDASDFLKEGQTWAAKAKVSASSNNSGVTTTGTYATRIGDAFEVLASGSFRRTSDYQDGDGNEIDGTGNAALSGLINARYRFGDDLEQYVRLSGMQFYSDGDNQRFIQTGASGYDWGDIDRTVSDTTLAVEYGNPFNGNRWLDMKVNLGFSDTTVEQENYDEIYAASFGNDSDYGYRTYSAKVENTSDLSTSDFFQTFLTVGSEYSHQERTASMIYGGTSSSIGYHPEGTQQKISGFSQSEMIFGDRLTVIPGIRYDYYMNEPGSGSSGGDETQGAVSPKLAAMVSVTDYLSVFGSVAYTERAATLDELYSSSAESRRGSVVIPARTASLDLDPEKSTNIEGGFAVNFSNLFGEDRLTAKFTAFQNNVRDLIEENTSGPTYYHNVSKAKLYGVEVEANYVSDLFFARAAYSATRGKNETTGEALDTVAADTLSTSVGFTIPQRDLKLAWDSVYAADQKRVSSSGAATGGYGVHGISASWTPDEGTFAGIETRFAVENVFDRGYREHLSNEEASGRTFKLTLSKSFGG